MLSVLFWVWVFGGSGSTCVMLVLVFSTVVVDEDVVDSVVGCESVVVCDCMNADSVLGGRRAYGEALMAGSYR
jgi:hypothetical protein